MTVGQKIIRIRRERGIMQEDVAKALGVTRQTVSKWENDLMPVSEDKRKELAEYLGVDLFASDEIAATADLKIHFNANQKIIIAIIGVFVAMACAVTVIVGIVSLPNLWSDEKGATSLYVDAGYFWLALGITFIIIGLEVFACISYKKENSKKSCD